jgi:hypothetical protein
MENMQSGIFDRSTDVDGKKIKARLNNLAWALLLMLVGVGLLLQHVFDIGLKETLNTIEMGIGVIFVGTNVAARLQGLRMNTFWFAVGILLIADGIDGMLRLDIPVFALALTAIGAWIVLKSTKKGES